MVPRVSLFALLFTAYFFLPNIALAQSKWAPSGDAVKLKGADFHHYRNNNRGYPKVQGDMITLTPDDQYSASGVIWLKKSILLPYKVQFEYSIYDDDGGGFSTTNSADGIVFMFAKDPRNYKAPPIGGSRGFIKDGTGFGIDLKTFSGEEVRLINGSGRVLKSVPYYKIPGSPKIYTHRKWQKVSILVTRSGVEVKVAGQVALKHGVTVRSPFHGLGFGAATGGSDSEHRLRKIEVTPYSPVKATEKAIAQYLKALMKTGVHHDRWTGLINEMGHQDYSRRKQAAAQLFQSPVLPVALLKEASRSKNIDIRVRAVYILDHSRGVRTTEETTRRVLVSIQGEKVKGLVKLLVQLIAEGEGSKNGSVELERALISTSRPSDRAFLVEKAKSLGPWGSALVARVLKALASSGND